MTLRHPSVSEGGFTLVEMLVATTLVAFLAVLLFGGLRFGSRAWDRSHEIYSSERAMRAAQSYLTAALEQAYPAREAPQMTVTFDGSAQAMSWLTMSGATDGDMSKIGLSLKSAGDAYDLAAGVTHELATVPSASRTLLTGVAQARFAYFGRRRGEATPHWTETWQGQTRLPDLVRIRLVMRDGRTVWPDLVVAPRITADVGCTLDMITHDCAGR